MKVFVAASILVVLFVSAASAQTWDPEMQLKVKAVGTPRVSPDGKPYRLHRQRSRNHARQERVCHADLDGKHRHQTEHRSLRLARSRRAIRNGRLMANGSPSSRTARTTKTISIV